MLTQKELKRIANQEGPLDGAPLFESVWREERGLAEAFVRYCDAEHPGAFVRWDAGLTPRQRSDFFVPMVAALEAAVCASSADPLDDFLDALPPAEGERAAGLVKAALGTTGVKLKRRARIKPDPAQLRAVHLPLDALWAAYDAKRPYERADLEALRGALAACDPPPVSAKDLKGYVEEAAGCLSAPELAPRAVYSLIWMLRAALPHHAPDLVAFRRRLSDPNLKPQAKVDEIRALWLPRLLRLAASDRLAAARALEAAVRAPQLAAERDALCAALTEEPTPEPRTGGDDQ